MNDLEDLAKTYGPAAPFSEHKKDDRITYMTAEGTRASGVIIWVQAATNAIGVKYVVAPDDLGAFLDFIVPGDVLQVEDVTQEQEPTMQNCPYCPGKHYDVNQCPLKPGKE